MAVLTTHVLNGVEGIHAEGVAVTLRHIASGRVLFRDRTDAAGRLQREVPAADLAAGAEYDLVFAVGPYWAGRGRGDVGTVRECVYRFLLLDPEVRMHVPINLSPHSHALWWSA
ncbi:hydroxyisourate hydrolase [Acidimangrovimonas pyrenivorans]|uniref:Hydroxyisourate hydrolase n=1 Tax=Acidimangrovimonas pyrenivorans TaxID=2030798 RepID=A0ABV7AGC7_9RHOB